MLELKLLDLGRMWDEPQGYIELDEKQIHLILEQLQNDETEFSELRTKNLDRTEWGDSTGIVGDSEHKKQTKEWGEWTVQEKQLAEGVDNKEQKINGKIYEQKRLSLK